MGIINKLRAQQIKNATSIALGHPGDPALVEALGGRRTASGQEVNSDTAMRVSAVYAAVKRKTDGVAMVPIQLKRHIEGGSEQANAHPLYDLLRHQPNGFQTSLEFREYMQGCLELRGNAYAHKVMNNRGHIEQLIPLSPDHVRPFWVSRRRGVIAYRHTDPQSGQGEVLLQNEVFHVRGLSLDGGLSGLNPVEYHRETIGHSMAQTEYSARFFANDATPPLWLEHPGNFKEKEMRREFLSNVKEMTTGEARHSPLLLEYGVKLHQLAINQKDAQYIEGKKFSVSEIARIFQVSPHLIGDLERATFSNITQMSLEHVIYTLLPQYTRWEHAVHRDLLLTREDKRDLFIKFIVEGLLRGDTLSRYQAYHLAILDGHLSRQEVRKKEDMNEVEGLDEFMYPANQFLVGETENAMTAGSGGSREQQMTDAAAKRIVSKEHKAISKAMDKIADKLEKQAWLDQFYQEHVPFVADVLSVEEAEARDYCERSAMKWKDFVDTYGDVSGRFELAQYHQLLNTAATAGYLNHGAH